MSRSVQEILKAFDRRETPFLTVAELSEEIDVSCQETTRRLEQMGESGHVGMKRSTTGIERWWAKVAPELSDEARRRADNATRERELARVCRENTENARQVNVEWSEVSTEANQHLGEGG